jgi:hypothetical protein
MSGDRGSGGPKRPYVDNGRLRWLPVDDRRLSQPFRPFSGAGRQLGEQAVGSHTEHSPPPVPEPVSPVLSPMAPIRGFVPFSGQGHRLNATQPLPGGPLSQENIDFLRSRADRRQYLGLRHTSNEQDRIASANLNNTPRPGFYGDAYSLVPQTTLDRSNQVFRQRFPTLFAGQAPEGHPGTDKDFNRAIAVGIRNSIAFDLGRGGTTLGQIGGQLSADTQFAIADMGRAPGNRQDAQYGSSTASFGKTHVPPQQVLRQITASPGQIRQGLQEQGFGPESSIDSELTHRKVTRSIADTYGSQINRGLDDMRAQALGNESPDQRRQRIAAAAELRQLQQQARGRPSVRESSQARMQQLQDIVKGPPKD